ncbi:MAG: hypothetical protein IPN69_21125 [Acidobacteria bacterium]|nr:hypothetical protein [Acidobacteriota bacterium]
MAEIDWKHFGHWRKNNGYLVILGIAAFVLVLVPYFWRFSGSFAEKQDVWGQFGDYIGGLMNPVLSVILLIAVLKELRHSSLTIIDNRKNIKRQNTFDVSQMFQSQGMMESRLAASKLLKALPL